MLAKTFTLGLTIAFISVNALENNHPDEATIVRSWSKLGVRFKPRNITFRQTHVTVTQKATTASITTYAVQTVPPQRSVKRAFLNQWSYQGCSNGAGLPNVVSPFSYQLQLDEVSGASCQAFCDQRGDSLAATQNGNLCWCGKKDANLTFVDHAQCNVHCAAQPGETCGGEDMLTIYTKAG